MYLYAAYLHPIKFWPLNLFYIEILRHAVCVCGIYTHPKICMDYNTHKN